MTSRFKPAARRESGISFQSMIVLSLLLHALFLSILLLSPSMPSRKWTFGPVYTVDLVSFPSDLSEKRLTSSISSALTDTASREHSATMKKQAESISPPAPVRKSPSLKKEDISKIEKAIDNVKKKVSSVSNAPVSSTAPRSPGTVAAGVATRNYYAVIWSRIKDQWALPRGIVPGDNIEAIIDVKILRDGTVSGISYEKSSGNRYFDQSAVKAIRKASPFPPFPDTIRENSIEVGIRFHSAELR
ncbi:MAG: energy transducer TonB [Syntrophales bacterium]